MIDAPTRSVWTFPNTTEDYEGHLSPSQVTEFLRCGECYRLNRIEHLPRPLGISLAIGSAVHRAIEQVRRQAAKNGEAVDVAGDWFDQQISQPTDPEEGTPLAEIDLGSRYKTLGDAKDHVIALTEFAIPKILEMDKARGKIAGVEVNLVELPGPSPYPFRMEGRMDATYVDWLSEPKPEDATVMSDVKTSKDLRKPDEYVSIAQTIYEEFYHSRGKPLVVIADVFSKTVRRGQYVPEYAPFPLAVDDYGRQLVHRTVLEVADDISSGRFRARPTYLCPFLHGFPEFQIAVSGFAEVEDGD